MLYHGDPSNNNRFYVSSNPPPSPESRKFWTNDPANLCDNHERVQRGYSVLGLLSQPDEYRCKGHEILYHGNRANGYCMKVYPPKTKLVTCWDCYDVSELCGSSSCIEKKGDVSVYRCNGHSVVPDVASDIDMICGYNAGKSEEVVTIKSKVGIETMEASVTKMRAESSPKVGSKGIAVAKEEVSAKPVDESVGLSFSNLNIVDDRVGYLPIPQTKRPVVDDRVGFMPFGMGAAVDAVKITPSPLSIKNPTDSSSSSKGLSGSLKDLFHNDDAVMTAKLDAAMGDNPSQWFKLMLDSAAASMESKQPTVGPDFDGTLALLKGQLLDMPRAVRYPQLHPIDWRVFHEGFQILRDAQRRRRIAVLQLVLKVKYPQVLVRYTVNNEDEDRLMVKIPQDFDQQVILDLQDVLGLQNSSSELLLEVKQCQSPVIVPAITKPVSPVELILIRSAKRGFYATLRSSGQQYFVVVCSGNAQQCNPCVTVGPSGDVLVSVLYFNEAEIDKVVDMLFTDIVSIAASVTVVGSTPRSAIATTQTLQDSMECVDWFLAYLESSSNVSLVVVCKGHSAADLRKRWQFASFSDVVVPVMFVDRETKPLTPGGKGTVPPSARSPGKIPAAAEPPVVEIKTDEIMSEHNKVSCVRHEPSAEDGFSLILFVPAENWVPVTEQPIAQYIQGCNTKVRRGGIIPCHSSEVSEGRLQHPGVWSGFAIGTETTRRTSFGTLGGFVHVGGRVYGISCAHVCCEDPDKPDNFSICPTGTSMYHSTERALAGTEHQGRMPREIGKLIGGFYGPAYGDVAVFEIEKCPYNPQPWASPKGLQAPMMMFDFAKPSLTAAATAAAATNFWISRDEDLYPSTAHLQYCNGGPIVARCTGAASPTPCAVDCRELVSLEHVGEMLAGVPFTGGHGISRGDSGALCWSANLQRTGLGEFRFRPECDAEKIIVGMATSKLPETQQTFILPVRRMMKTVRNILGSCMLKEFLSHHCH